MARQIMYLGKQTNRRDNVNRQRMRRWAGLGDIVEVDDAGAKALVAFPDVFADVTDLSSQKINAIVKSLEERYRREQQVVQGVTVNNATIQQLEEQLDRLKAAPTQVTQQPASPLTDTTPARPQDDEVVKEQIMAAMQTLDPKDEALFTRNREPTVDAVQQVLGYPITAGERDDAWAELTIPDTSLE